MFPICVIHVALLYCSLDLVLHVGGQLIIAIDQVHVAVAELLPSLELLGGDATPA